MTKRFKLVGEPNPLLIKELRGRMRGARAYVVLTVYLLLLSCFASLIYYTSTSAMSSSPGIGANMAEIGKAVFYTIVLVEIFMVTFITPAFTAGAITSERERQTYELLRATLLPARRVISGKLASALTYMLLLILAAIPLQSLAFMLGGVTVEELGLALIVLLVTALLFGTIGLLLSSLLRSTLAATVLVYAVALLLMIGLPVVMLIFLALMDPILYGYSSELSFLAEAALFYLFYFLVNLSPLGTAIATEVVLIEEGSAWFFWMDLSSTHRIPVPSGWIVFVLIYLFLCAIMLLLTVLRVRRQEVN